MADKNARQEIYNAARELMFAVEQPFDTEQRIFFAVRKILHLETLDI